MSEIPGFNDFDELNIFYKSENMQNTDIPEYADLNPRRPDAYIGFNNVFFYPQAFFNDSVDIMDPEWYY